MPVLCSEYLRNSFTVYRRSNEKHMRYRLLVGWHVNSKWVNPSDSSATIGRPLFRASSRCGATHLCSSYLCQVPEVQRVALLAIVPIGHWLKLHKVAIVVIHFIRSDEIVTKETTYDQDWSLNAFRYYLHQLLYMYSTPYSTQFFVSTIIFGSTVRLRKISQTKPMGTTKCAVGLRAQDIRTWR